MTPNPETVHVMASGLRLGRGLITAAERWVRSESFSRDEALVALKYWRRVLDAYERSLGSSVDIAE